MLREKKIVMLGTKPDACGGIASVITNYHINGLLERQNIAYLATHSTACGAEKYRLLVVAFYRFCKMLLLRRVSIVHAHVACDASFWRKSVFLTIAYLCGIPTILHLHAGHFPEFYQNRCNRFSKICVKSIFNNVQQIVVVSNALNTWVKSICEKTSVVTILNPAVILDRSCHTCREKSLLIFLGHLGSAKGTYDLIQAMPKVLTLVPNAKLMLCGDGELRRAHQLITQLALHKHIKVLGWVNCEKRTQLLSKASVFVLPSYAEGLPMSVLEAMAQGLPIVATNVGGIPEAISNETEGLLVEPGDINALADSIIRLLKHPEQGQRMGDAGRKKVEVIFTATKAISSLEALYDNVKAERSRMDSRKQTV